MRCLHPFPAAAAAATCSSPWTGWAMRRPAPRQAPAPPAAASASGLARATCRRRMRCRSAPRLGVSATCPSTCARTRCGRTWSLPTTTAAWRVLGGAMAHRPFEFPALGAARPPTPPPPLPQIGIVDNAALAAIMKDKAELDDKACMARASRPRRLRGQRPCPPRSACSSAYSATSRISWTPTPSSMPSWCALRCTGSSAAAHDAVSIGRRRAMWRS